jgi:proline dehydrogenase
MMTIKTVAASVPFRRMVRRIPEPSMQLTRHLSSNSRTKSTVALGRNNDHNIEEQEVLLRSNVTKNPIPDFDNARITFESKSTKELLRATACFQTCKIPLLVENAERLLLISRNLFGGRIVDAVLKATFYGHFCAGEDQERIKPVIQKLNDAGVGSILDYAAESNDEPVEGMMGGGCLGVESSTGLGILSPFDRRNIVTVTAREYDYESEAKCDQHVSTFLQCIRDVATNSKDGGDKTNNGYAAIKVTALGNPKLLARLSKAIVEAKRLFSMFDTNGDGLVSRGDFELGYK